MQRCGCADVSGRFYSDCGWKILRYQADAKLYRDNRLGDNLKTDVELSESKANQLIQTKSSLLEELAKAFEAAGLTVTIDTASGVVNLNSSILFGFDDAALSDEGKSYLDKFFSVYSTVVMDEKYAGVVAEIVVEGHTDTKGEYDCNKKLSQQRVQTVLTIA